MHFVADLRSNDIELHTHQDGQVDLSEPIHAAIEIFRAAVAAEEKRKEIERAIAATEERIEAGKWQGVRRSERTYRTMAMISLVTPTVAGRAGCLRPA